MSGMPEPVTRENFYNEEGISVSSFE